LAKKKAATRGRRSATRKKKVKTPESAARSSPATADETVEQQRAAAKHKKTARRLTRKKAAPTGPGGTAGLAAQGEAATARETAAGDGSARPSAVRKKRRRRRSTAKMRQGEAAADRTSAEQRPPAPRVKAVSASAEVEQNEDTIVIRFPSAAPPSDQAPARSTADEETARPLGAAESEAYPHEAAIEPPIDWEAAEEPTEVAEEPETAAEVPRSADDSEARRTAPVPAEPSRDDETRAALPEQTEKTAEPPTAKAARLKRRHRRKKKDPRLAPKKETVQDERVEAEVERRRPRPASETRDAAEPSAEEKPLRRRRRRSRRGRKQEVATAAPEAAHGAAVDTARKPQRPIESSTAPTPSTQKEMIINVVPREECRIAIMENGKLQEIYLERASAENFVGNIYKGIVTNVEPSIQAAFVNFGQSKNGFLHISDLHPQYFPNGEGNTENVGRKMPRRSRPPIQRCLRRGQQLLVQITKEGIGTKGPTLTTYLSIPGRFLVMMPGMRQLGVSRRIEDDEARRKLRTQLLDLALPENIGFIARTAALDRTKRELQSDLGYLSRLWKAVQKRIESQKAPAEIYTESDLVIRTIRDVYTSDITRIVVDDHDVAERAHEFLSIFSPRSRDTVAEYDQPEPIFHRYGIEAELERLHARHVPLKSGGSLVIDQTEALVAVDVNSGRFRTENDAEATAYKINLEAADEIPRQLRLRDLGGVVICDFIDMRQEKHKREIERRLARNLKEHKERAKLLRMSDFGIIELTRQRQRASLTHSVYQECQYCRGTGLAKTVESVVLDVMRFIQLAVTRENIRSIEVAVSAEVADRLQNDKRGQLHELETKNQRRVSICAEPGCGLDQITIQCKDARGRIVAHP